MNKYLSFIGIGGGIIVAFLLWHNYQVTQEKAEIDALTFSNTQEWGQEFLSLKEREIRSVPNWEQLIEISPPPANSSDTTQQELKILIEYKTLRTGEKLATINEELNYQTAEIGGMPIAEYFNSTKYPFTSLLISDPLLDISAIVLNLKEKFNRVRPSFLESAIDPEIEIPGHPAYPSGHSTQSHFVAYMLGELMPSRRQEFIVDAESIAKNREIAGVHYPSDSAAGAELARQFFNLIKQDPEIKRMISLARLEWQE
jgi:acid phosphatase (class A)